MTDNVPTSTPPGWYPAPDGSPVNWWWDGTRWTQPQQLAQLQPYPQLQQQPEPRPGTTNAIAKLAIATQVLLLACIVVAVATIANEAFGIIAVTDFLTGVDTNVDRFDVYDRGTFVVSILSPVFLIATGVIWVIWQYRVAKQVAGQTRRSPGWHAGSWFVPIISLWFPYQNISDLWRAVGRTRPSWQIVWWLLWVISNYVAQASTRIYLIAEDLEMLRVAMWTSIAAEVLLLAAAPMAWLVVRGITRGIVQRTAEPVHSLAA